METQAAAQARAQERIVGNPYLGIISGLRVMHVSAIGSPKPISKDLSAFQKWRYRSERFVKSSFVSKIGIERVCGGDGDTAYSLGPGAGL
jgi:hypothetical protein